MVEESQARNRGEMLLAHYKVQASLAFMYNPGPPAYG